MNNFNTYYKNIKSCTTIDQLEKVFQIIQEDDEIIVIQFNMLTDIYNYHKILLA